MRRLALIGVLIAAGLIAALGTGAGNDGDVYRVRAIFLNAFSVIPGEDAKIAGVKVGKIESLDVTDDHKAVVVLAIDEPGFQDFRTDAECSIRPQSLIGEKFIECVPTQPKAPGEPKAPPLQTIEEGDGAGQHLLPVDRTRKPIDLDLVNNVLRLPYRQRLSIIINELGSGLAGRGRDLNLAIRNANPALRETDEVLRILASQNKVLKKLASDGDRILAPLARERRHVAGFVEHAATVSEATAERRADLERNIQKLPAFLRELQPTMKRLGSLSDEATPVMRDLGRVAPDVSRFIRELGPFSEQATPAVKSLGDAADVGRVALVKSKPIVDDLRTFGAEGKPLLKNLSDVLTSFRSTGGIERLMDYIFFQATAVNGYDSVGHYLRAILVVNTCSTYAMQNDSSCTANFNKGSGGARAASAEDQLALGRSPALVRTDQVLRGADPDDVLGHNRKKTKREKAPASEGIALPPAVLPGQAPAPAPAPSGPKPSPSGQGPVKALLDYLLGDPLG